MRICRLALVGVSFACALMLIACGSNNKKAESLKPAKLVDFEPSTKLKKVWGTRAGSGMDKRYSQFVPVIKNDTLFAADVEGRVYAFAFDSGKQIWKTDLKVDISAAVGVSDKHVFVASYTGEVIALDSSTGERLWSAQASSEILAPPQSDGTFVIAQTIDGRLFAFSVETGERKWAYDHTVPVLTLRGSATPTIVSSQVITGFDNGQLVSLSIDDGSLRWQTRIAQPKGRTELERIVDIDSTPIVDGGIVYSASYQGNLAGISRGQGRKLWETPLSTYNRIAADNDKIYVTTENAHVVAFTASSGEEVWRNEQLFRRQLGAPVIVGDYIACIDKKGYMHLLKRDNGEFAFRFEPRGKGFRTPPVGLDNQILVMSDNGDLTLYELAE